MVENYTPPEKLFTRAMLWHVLDLPAIEAAEIMPVLASMAALSEPLEARLHAHAEGYRLEERAMQTLFSLCGEQGQRLEIIWNAKPLAVFIATLKACPGSSIPAGVQGSFTMAIRSAESFHTLLIDLVRTTIAHAEGET